jgi:Holliday junction resolvase RusA-like endonuclease
VALDALQGSLYLNDSQIVALHLYRYDDKANPRIEVSVQDA